MAANPERPTLTKFANKAGISISYASQLLTDDPTQKRIPTVEMSLVIYRRTGVKLGILVGASDKLCKDLVRLAEENGIIAREIMVAA
jgi:transcriptional regulator with XRE-family HTH domain